MTSGIDFAFFPHPPTSAISAAFVGRYCSSYGPNDTNGKNLLPGELKTLRGAGKSIILYCEETSGYLKGGHAAGVSMATHFDAVTKALGMTGAVAFLAADWDASQADQAAVNAALDGCASVIGRARTGIYGGFWPVSRALTAGKASFAVQTYAWSTYEGGALPAHAIKWEVGGHTYLADPRAQIRQGQIINIGGASCDSLTAYAADYGQWPRPKDPAPKPADGPPYRHQVAKGNDQSFTKYAESTRHESRDALLAYNKSVTPKSLSEVHYELLAALADADSAAEKAGVPRCPMQPGTVIYTAHP
jgi:hypothetical protein